jgi:hypothetical protein
MPIRLSIDPASKVVLTTCTGAVTISEVAETCARLAQHPAFDREFSHLNDLTAISEVHISFSEIERFVSQRLEPFAPDSKRVYVAGQPFVYGLARMYESLANLPGLVVVRSMEEGRRMLALEPEAAVGP